MSDYINIVSLNCGRFDKKIDVKDKTPEEIKEIVRNLVVDRNKYLVVIT